MQNSWPTVPGVEEMDGKAECSIIGFAHRLLPFGRRSATFLHAGDIGRPLGWLLSFREEASHGCFFRGEQSPVR